MLTPEIALSFFGIAVLLALSPGPDNLFVLTQSVLWGRTAGLCVVLGLCTGVLGHTVAVSVGLAAVFAASSAVHGRETGRCRLSALFGLGRLARRQRVAAG